MKTFIKSLVVICIALFTTNLSSAQTKNLQIVDVKVYGNCGMCKKTIEKAANVNGISKAEWDADMAMAKVTIDTTKTTVDDVLKRIAAVGYDSEKFRAPDEAYNSLPGCCQYDRPAKKHQ
ncbi:MAG: heavy-metal-associated domain-containing protein [Saprospiraceae bacterium]|nr:heavy-metal-associated domain-containing protein [Saprospiraceae bacterium]